MEKSKNEKVKVVALLTAAGVGSRMHYDIPKQFIPVEDKPIIVYTLEAFQNHPGIDEIIVSCLDGYDTYLYACAKQYNITKLKNIVKGGRTGQESITNCLDRLKEIGLDDNDIVMVHDGNRPLVPSGVITESIASCITKGNAVAHVPCNGVVIKTEDQYHCDEQLDRDYIKITQTPHTFRFGKLYKAYKLVQEEGKTNMVAPCSVMMALGEEVFLSTGSELNFKITTQEDLVIFKALVRTRKMD